MSINSPQAHTPDTPLAAHRTSEKGLIRIHYDGKVFKVTPEYYNYVLDYVFYDCLKKSRTLHHFDKIDLLTAGEFKSRYNYSNERKYKSCIFRYDTFRRKNTFALDQPMISSPLDKIIPKPTFAFTHSLLELDHWCQCVVFSSIKTALKTLGITLETSTYASFAACIKTLSKLELSMLEEIEIRDIQRTTILSPIEDNIVAGQQQKQAQRYSYTIASPPSSPLTASYQQSNTRAVDTEVNLETLLGNSTPDDPNHDDPHLEAFCRIVQDGIDNLEPATHFIINESKRHKYVETFRQCKQDIIDAILRCIPETEARSHRSSMPNLGATQGVVRPRSHSAASIFSAMLSSHVSRSSGTVQGDEAAYSSDATRFEAAEQVHVYNEFETLYLPTSQTTLARFLETFETCRRRMLYQNNPLHPTHFYLVDAGYLSDPRRRSKLTVPKKQTFQLTIEFHKQLLKKEVELGYHKYLWETGGVEGGGVFNGAMGVEQFNQMSLGMDSLNLMSGPNRESTTLLSNISDTLSNEKGKTCRESMGLDELINDSLACLDGELSLDLDPKREKRNTALSIGSNECENVTGPNQLLEEANSSSIQPGNNTNTPLLDRNTSLGSSTLLNRASTLKTLNQLSTLMQMSSTAQEERCYIRYYSMLAYTIRVHYFPYNRIKSFAEFYYDDEYVEAAFDIIMLIDSYMNGTLGDLDEVIEGEEGDSSRVTNESIAGNTQVNMKPKRKPVKEKMALVDCSARRRAQVDALIDRKIKDISRKKRNLNRLRKLDQLRNTNLGQGAIMTEDGNYFPLVSGYSTFVDKNGELQYGLYGQVGYDSDQESAHILADISNNIISEIGSGIEELARKMKEWKSPCGFVKQKIKKVYYDNNGNLTDTTPLCLSTTPLTRGGPSPGLYGALYGGSVN